MASPREYFDGIVEAVTKLRQLDLTDEELADWVDDLQSAESGLHQMASCIDDVRGGDEPEPAEGKLYVVAVGTLADGFTFYGPSTNVTSDVRFVNDALPDVHWNWAELRPLHELDQEGK